MRRFLAAVICAGLPVSGMAEEAGWWVGKWAYDPAICVNADKIGGVDPAPFEITANQMIGYENSCQIAQVYDLQGSEAIYLVLNCTGEGETYQAQHVLMRQDAETIWYWYGYDVPEKYTRC